MIRLFFSLVLFLVSYTLSSAQTEKLNQLFEQYQNTDGVTSIKIAKPMFSMLNKLDIRDSELNQIKPLLSKIQGLKLLIVEGSGNTNDKNIGNIQNLKHEINAAVNNLHYEELMTVNNKDAKVKFLSPEVKNGIMDNLLLNINAEGSTILMMLDGKISMDDLSKLMEENKANTNTTKSNSTKSNSSSEERKLDSFSGIEAVAGIKINYTQNKNQKVVVETDAGMLPYIVTVVKNGVLKVYLDNKDLRNLNLGKVVVNVQSPSLNTLSLTSGASFSSNQAVTGKDFKITTTSGASVKSDFNISGNMTIQSTSGSQVKLNLKAKSLDLSATSAAEIKLSGKVDTADYKLTSAANCNALDLNASSAKAATTSQASLKLNADDYLKAIATSSSSIKYSGTPKNKETDTSSSGSIKAIE